ncbi:CbiQ family ECF transporter T component [Kytococcus sp. Marseille-QA3725]
MTATYRARPSAPPRSAVAPTGGAVPAPAADRPAPTADVGSRTVGRRLHPWAWWAWALLVAAAVSMTTNPLLVVLVAAAVVAVTLLKRTDDLWARSLRVYLLLAATVVVLRVVFQVLLGSDRPGTVLFILPELPLPAWAAGIRVGGPVRAEPLLASVHDALRLGAMLLCVGAANALANPRRALRSVPSALYEVSVAVVIALTVAPQLVVSTVRAHRARRLRGGRTRGLRVVRTLLVPVLEDAVEQSLALAAGMEARGFGRTRTGAPRRLVSVLLLGSVLALTYGTFVLLGGAGPLHGTVVPAAAGPGVLALGVALAAAGLWLSGRGSSTTRHRPDPWRAPESVVALAGLGCLLTVLWLAGELPLASPLRAAWLNPPVEPLAAPQLHPLMLVVPALAALPALVAPRPPLAPGGARGDGSRTAPGRAPAPAPTEEPA